MHIFTYGTLMFSDVWQVVVGRENASVSGAIGGFSIFRVRDALYPGIVAASESCRVRGVVYLDVDEVAVAALDRFEDDFYQRQSLTIVCDDGHQRQADAYVVPLNRREVLTEEPWSGESFVARGDLEKFIRGFAGFTRAREGTG